MPEIFCMDFVAAADCAARPPLFGLILELVSEDRLIGFAVLALDAAFTVPGATLAALVLPPCVALPALKKFDELDPPEPDEPDTRSLTRIVCGSAGFPELKAPPIGAAAPGFDASTFFNVSSTSLATHPAPTSAVFMES